MPETRHLALLRGVNVGGKVLSMEKLRRLADQLGLGDVATYIQSGNLLFSSASSDTELTKRLEHSIEEHLGMNVTVIMRTPEQMKNVLDRNPFLQNPCDVDVKRLHVTFLAADAPPAAATRGEAGPDRYVIRGRHVYLHCPESYGRSDLNNAFFEKLLRARATTRNWNSVVKLTDMLGA